MAWHQSGQHTKVIILCVPWDLGIFEIWMVQQQFWEKSGFLIKHSTSSLLSKHVTCQNLERRGRKHTDMMKMYWEAFFKKKEMP